MNVYVNKKLLATIVMLMLMFLQGVIGNPNLFLLLAISASAFYLSKIDNSKTGKICFGVVGIGYIAVFLLFFTKGVLIMFT